MKFLTLKSIRKTFFDCLRSKQFFSRLSQDFVYDNVVRLSDYTSKGPIGDEPLKYPVKGPRFHELGLKGIFDQPKVKFMKTVSIITDIRPKEDRDGYHLIIHDPYEIPTDKSVNVFTLANQTVEYLISPKVISFDKTLRKYSLEE